MWREQDTMRQSAGAALQGCAGGITAALFAMKRNPLRIAEKSNNCEF
jgi:hypothetical protein